MKLRLLLTLFSILTAFCTCIAQDLDQRVLMKVAGREVEAGEFLRMFRKSLEPGGSSVKVEEYLGQFIAFKLKVADAIERGYDTTKAFRQELNGYRNQLAQNYLIDPDIKENLLRKAYERYITEVNASHILIACSPDASPSDTLKAYQKALGIRERILGGEDFEHVAKASSDDKSVLINNGNLGYFTGFQMITPFEEAAYTLKPGIISMPVRTQYGYHIIKVNDRRPSKGRIKVAHIMKAVSIGADEEMISKAENEINEIYSRLRNGASFKKLASEFSDHKASATNGGELNWFGSGEIVSDFSEAAFSLADTGEYTRPVRSVNGFHIIKLLDRRPPGSFEEMKSSLEAKLNKSDLIAKAKKSFIEKLKKEYKFTIDPAIYKWFVNNTDTLIIKGFSSYRREKIPEGNIYAFNGRHLSAKEFAGHLENRGFRIVTTNPRYYIDSSIESIASADLISYENSVLEKKYPDFRYLMKEFHDGILLFEISSEKVWNRIHEDSAGFKAYYEKNKDEFLTEENIEAKIYSVKKAGEAKKLKKYYRKYSRKPDRDKRLLERFIIFGDTLLTIEEGKWFRGDNDDIETIEWKKGVHSLEKNGLPALIDILNVNHPEPRPFDEVKADMITGYQDWLTEEWIKQLKEKYIVEVDDQAIDEVKKRLQDE